MPKFILRIASLLLVSSLLVDPAFAAYFSVGAKTELTHRSIFENQALMGRLAAAYHNPFSGKSGIVISKLNKGRTPVYMKKEFRSFGGPTSVLAGCRSIINDEEGVRSNELRRFKPGDPCCLESINVYPLFNSFTGSCPKMNCKVRSGKIWELDRDPPKSRFLRDGARRMIGIDRYADELKEGQNVS